MKRFIIFFIAVLMSQMAFAQGWEPQVSPTTNILNAVVFVDTSNGWAVGDSGTIIHTTDGGATWTSQTSGTTFTLRGLDFVDANLGWVVGGDRSSFSQYGVLLRTTDGGSTWNTANSDSGYILCGTDFVDANNGWVVGGTMPDNGIILHSTDSGTTWAMQNSGTVGPLKAVSFVGTDTGWAVGGEYFETPVPLDDGFAVIIHTTDGGNTWTPQNTETTCPMNDLSFVDANHGWAVGGGGGFEYQCGSILRTTDGGTTWATQFFQECMGACPWFCSVDFQNLSTGWVVGVDCDIYQDCYGIMHTTDGGETWTTQGPDSLNVWYTGVDFADAINGWAVGLYGTILHTTNGGESWVERPENAIPADFVLHQNCPNPFNASTTITYDLPRAGRTSLRVYDLLGREVAVLKDGMMEAGNHRAMFDGSTLASGIYFARLEATPLNPPAKAGGEYVQTRKLMLLK